LLKVIKKILIAISFFTRIPIKLKNVNEEEFYSSLIYIPFSGLVIGLFIYLIGIGLSYLNMTLIQAFILLLAYIWITGGIHLDGFSDTVDGIFSARDRNKILEIMKDSNIGAFGAIGLILLLTGYVVAFYYVFDTSILFLLILPIIGKTSALLSGSVSTYAEGGGGLAKKFVEKSSFIGSIIYMLVTLLASFFLMGIYSVIVLVAVYIVVVMITQYIKKIIGGVTGDTIGFVIEISQVLYLFLMVIVFQYI
jgi:adenosylcobinamide-GDP ribazoletransferase